MYTIMYITNLGILFIVNMSRYVPKTYLHITKMEYDCFHWE